MSDVNAKITKLWWLPVADPAGPTIVELMNAEDINAYVYIPDPPPVFSREPIKGIIRRAGHPDVAFERHPDGSFTHHEIYDEATRNMGDDE